VSVYAHDISVPAKCYYDISAKRLLYDIGLIAAASLIKGKLCLWVEEGRRQRL
jgi:hypothetical protein